MERALNAKYCRSNVNPKTLPFEKVAHKVSTLDAQPSNETGGILVMVTGALLVSCCSVNGCLW